MFLLDCCFSVWSLMPSAFVCSWFEKIVQSLFGCLLFWNRNLCILFSFLFTLFHWKKTVCVLNVVHWFLLWLKLFFEKAASGLIKVDTCVKHDIIFLILYDGIWVWNWHGFDDFVFLDFLFTLPNDEINHMLSILERGCHRVS